MNETASASRGRRPAPPRPARVRLRPVVLAFLLVGALGRIGEAAAAPVTVGLGFGADIPTVPIAHNLTIDRGDPLGFALTVPVLVGVLRFEPQLTYSDRDRSYGMPAPGVLRCPGLSACESFYYEDERAGLGLSFGPTWSIGERGRLWAGPWVGAISRGSWSFRQPDWSMGVTVGGEFFLDRRFAVGLDVRGTYTSVPDGGAHTRTGSVTATGTRDTVDAYATGWTVGVDGLAAFRVYVN